MRLFYATREVLLFIKINMTRITHILIAAVTITMLTQCSGNDSRQEVEIPLDEICVGDIAFRRGEGITNPLLLMGDFDQNETVNLADTLLLLRDLVNQTFTQSELYHDKTSVSLLDVIHLLKNLAK